MSFFARLVEPPAPTIEGRPRRQRVDHDEVEQAIRKAPKTPLTAAEVHGIAPLTLSGAFALFTENGGQVVAADDGSLGFLVSEALPSIRRHRVLRAAAVLDASRAVVWRHLKDGEPLPARVPAAGGGVV